ncbi:hypothetical protein G3I59_19950 [Amycolatopsis rubida]|uniref:Tachylectin 2 domain-containing protein n=1 Tax=Amycolatopsis rubida TaxID=112413 RepID=A0ABX0BYH6_9PSEU|nr:tachylectin-related carbohydrate-binding protein [Amycolatopsis sp. M39]MYW92822.1 hypothetical protein [Amycolatopsis rubida]NEC57808.1 hypothetical protein [Amycolatopsis rubida]OAP21255.1 hypothetical protein A4R44_08002 [Amycolatopsis sp. M39]
MPGNGSALRRHQRPAALPASEPAPQQSTIGAGGWNGYVRLLAGPDGLVYGIRANDNGYRYQWNGTGWTADSRTVLATGWTGFDNAANHNRITIDSRGDIYMVNADGSLSRRRYDLVDRTPRHRLEFLQPHHRRRRRALHPKLVGNGSRNAFTRITSAGADVLYTVTDKGELRWYRYLPYRGTWSPGPTVIGDGGWQKFSDVEAQRNSCTVVR